MQSSASASKKASLASISHHDEGLPTFPLLTHSHVVDRRLRESQSTTAVDASEAEAESYDQRPVLRSLAQQQLSSLYQGYGIFGNCDLDKREGGECRGVRGGDARSSRPTPRGTGGGRDGSRFGERIFVRADVRMSDGGRRVLREAARIGRHGIG